MELDDAGANAAHTAVAEAFPPPRVAKARAFRARLGPRATLGLAYGASERQAYDLFQPEQEPSGAVNFMHGGYTLKFDHSFWIPSCGRTAGAGLGVSDAVV